MLTVLRQRNFSLLWVGQLISISGDWVLFIALPFYVYGLTGSTLATGGMFIASTLPRLLLGSVAGVFVDRWDRKRTMIAADLLRAALLLALLAVRSANDLWIIYVAAVLEASISQFFEPSEMALLPHLVSESHLVQANSLNSLGASIARLLAPTLGGALFAWSGLYSTVLFDSASFLFSASLLALIVAPSATANQAQHKEPAANWVSFWREWLEGLDLVKRDRVLSNLFLVWAIGMVGEGLVDVLFVPFVRQQLQGDALVLGWMMSAQAAGSLLGGGAIGWLGQRISHTRLLVFGALGGGLIDLVIFNSSILPFKPILPLVLALFVVVGVPLAGLIVSVNVLLQRDVSDQYRGRVFGAFGTTTALMMLAGMVLGGVLGDRLGVVSMLNVACLLLVLAGITTQLRLATPAPQVVLTPE